MIFRPEMVEKILAGEKTVTRRPVKFYWDETWEQTAPAPCRYEVGKTCPGPAAPRRWQAALQTSKPDPTKGDE